MDFTKKFDIWTLESGLRKGHPIGPAVVGAMENTAAWKNHAKKCAVAKVVSIGIDGRKINVDEIARRQVVLDHKEWRDDVADFAQMMIEGDRNKFVGINNIIPENVARSPNFSISNISQIYEKQNQHNIGCMCGVEVSLSTGELQGLKANSYGVSSSNGNEILRKSGVYTSNIKNKNSYA